MLQFLERLFLEREITSFNARDNRIMCFPHTINIAVQHVLDKMSLVKAPESDDNDDAEDLTDTADRNEGRGSGQTFEDACAEDPITCLRKIIRAIRSTRQHHDAFMTWIETGNRSRLFGLENNNPVHIQPKQLLRDIQTKWDSTYQMVKHWIEMRLVSPCTIYLNNYNLF
jgi:hypothetical protein